MNIDKIVTVKANRPDGRLSDIPVFQGDSVDWKRDGHAGVYRAEVLAVSPAKRGAGVTLRLVLRKRDGAELRGAPVVYVTRGFLAVYAPDGSRRDRA